MEKKQKIHARKGDWKKNRANEKWRTKIPAKWIALSGLQIVLVNKVQYSRWTTFIGAKVWSSLPDDLRSMTIDECCKRAEFVVYSFQWFTVIILRFRTVYCLFIDIVRMLERHSLIKYVFLIFFIFFPAY